MYFEKAMWKVGQEIREIAYVIPMHRLQKKPQCIAWKIPFKVQEWISLKV